MKDPDVKTTEDLKVDGDGVEVYGKCAKRPFCIH